MFPNKSVAYPEVTKLIRKVEGVFYTANDCHRNSKGGLQHCFVTYKSNDPSNKSVYPKFYLLYKRDFFRTFLAQFPHFKDTNDASVGLGESINKSALDFTIRSGVDWLLFIYEDGKVYKINPIRLMKFAEENKLIRSQQTSIGELTYSFPISLLERYGHPHPLISTANGKNK